MSYTAKSLLQKAKEIQAIEDAKRVADQLAKKEQKKIENAQKKLNQEFVNVIGVRCIEAALSNKYDCVISDAELVKFNAQIKACGLTVSKVTLTSEELKEDFPEKYEELGIESELESILSDLEDLEDLDEDYDEENENIFDKNLAEINDYLFNQFESALADDWHLTFIEKKITDEILSTGFKHSFSYDNDQELFNGLSELLQILKKYKVKGVIDLDSDMEFESCATKVIQELIEEIPTITKALKKHNSVVDEVRSRIDKELRSQELKINNLERSRDRLLSKTYTLNVIDWMSDNFTDSANSFLQPRTLCWIMNNPLMMDLFKFIEKKIREKNRSCEILFKSFNQRYIDGKYFCSGIYFDDFLVEIPMESIQKIFECLGYHVNLTSTAPKSSGPSDPIQKYCLKVSWPSL